MKFTIAIPTYADKADCWRENIRKFSESLKHLISDGLSFRLRINFQDYPKADFDYWSAFLKERAPLGLDTSRYHYSKPVAMAQIRGDLAKNLDANDIYMVADDDMEFRPGCGLHYLRTLRTFKKYKTLGGVMCMGTMGSRREIGPAVQLAKNGAGMWWTARGLFLRKMPGHPIFPEWCVHPGTMEETSAVYNLVEHGYFLAKSFQTPCRHVVSGVEPELYEKHLDRKQRYSREEDMHLPERQEKVFAEIRQRYGDSSWSFSKRRLPRKLEQAHNVAEKGMPQILEVA
jgi:hypothetical protein